MDVSIFAIENKVLSGHPTDLIVVGIIEFLSLNSSTSFSDHKFTFYYSTIHFENHTFLFIQKDNPVTHPYSDYSQQTG